MGRGEKRRRYRAGRVGPRRRAVNGQNLLNAATETKGLGLGAVVPSNGLTVASPSKGSDCLRDLPSACASHACARRLFSRHGGTRRCGGGKFLCDRGVTLAWDPSRRDANLLREIKVYLQRFNQEVGGKKKKKSYASFLRPQR